MIRDFLVWGGGGGGRGGVNMGVIHTCLRRFLHN